MCRPPFPTKGHCESLANLTKVSYICQSGGYECQADKPLGDDRDHRSREIKTPNAIGSTQMKILFLHGWRSAPGGRKPTHIKDAGHEVINPKLDDDDFAAAVRSAQSEYNKHHPDVIVGSSRGGAVAVNMDSGDTPLVLLCPAWRNWGTATTVKANTVILHSRQDDTIPFADSEELVANSGLPPESLMEVGNDHRLADEESLEAMLDACFNVCLPEWNDEQKELLQQDWDGLCYSAAMRWITATKDSGWLVVHGTVFSGELEKRIEHAWCERGDIIVDLAMHPQVRVIDRYTYYRTIRPEISNVYSSTDALMLSLRNRHQGPWNESEQLPPDEDTETTTQSSGPT